MMQGIQTKQKNDSASLQMLAKQRKQRQRTFFCRLCRKYGIKTRKSHLKNYHRADPDTVTKRVTNDLIDAIFVESR